MESLNTFLILVLFLDLFLLCSAQAPDDCRTPRGAQGKCKVIPQCPVLAAILQQESVSPHDAAYLRSSRCGTEGMLPKVCCPLVEDPSRIGATPVTSSLLPSLDVCGINAEHRIFSGNETDFNQYPWMALLEKQDDGIRSFYCGGSLINNRYIVTAAHCLKAHYPESWTLVNVRLGEHNTDTDPDCKEIGSKRVCMPAHIDVPVEQLIIHESYDASDRNFHHDIGLVRLARDIHFSDSIKPICLPTTANVQNQDLSGKTLVVAGWGATKTSSRSPVKLKVELPFKPYADCARTYINIGIQLNTNQLCAGGERGKDSCFGDSGGPLMRLFMDENRNLNWYCIGVVSFGMLRCGQLNTPGVYTKVDNYVQWIVGKLEP